MVDYKRINPKLSDLPISSSISIFSFLNELLEKHELSWKIFDQQLSSFTIGEKYFIVKYSILYFDYYNTKSHLRLWIENKERSMVDYDKFSIQKHEIKYNSEVLVSNCKQMLPSYKRRFTHILINYPTRFEFSDGVERRQIKERCKRMIRGRKKPKGSAKIDTQQAIRIPITLKINFESDKEEISVIDSNLVIDNFKVCFSDLVSEGDLKILIRNTFRESGSDNQFYPLILLYIEVQNKAILYERIYNFYTYYTEEVKHNLILQRKRKVEKIESKLKRLDTSLRNNKKLSLSEEEIIKRLEKKGKELNDRHNLNMRYTFQSTNYSKYDFLCAFYFSFPIIRESYFKAKLKNPSKSISDYFNTESRNLKSRKKSN